MARLLQDPSHSLKELRILPAHTRAGDSGKIQLRARLCRDSRVPDGFIPLQIPILSAAMQAVTGPELAIAIARLGGIGVLPVSQSIEAQAAAVDRVKRDKAGFQRDIRTLSPRTSMAEVVDLMRETGYTRFPVTDTGVFHGRLLGILTDKDFDGDRDLDCVVEDRMRKEVQAGVELEDLEEANRLMVSFGRGFLPIVSREGTLQSVVFKKDRDKHREHPHESVDAERRLRVAAAVSTHPEDIDRIDALLDREVDLLVIDASDGHTDYQAATIAEIKRRGPTPVIAGNVVTAAGFDFLASAGADAVKVGMGIGSGCTTQEVKATGRGQATALIEVVAARDALMQSSGEYVPIIADGGIASAAEISVALALGADTVMLGNLLARFTESPGALVRGESGEMWKEYWMEGSARGANFRRYAQKRDGFFEEGTEGWVPHAGTIDVGLPKLGLMLQSTLGTAGCATLEEFREHAVLEWVSEAGLRDSNVRGMRVASPVQAM